MTKKDIARIETLCDYHGLDRDGVTFKDSWWIGQAVYTILTPNTVYVKGVDIGAIGHELTHRKQLKKYGAIRYLLAKSMGRIYNLFGGDNPLEDEAYAIEDKINMEKIGL